MKSPINQSINHYLLPDPVAVVVAAAAAPSPTDVSRRLILAAVVVVASGRGGLALAGEGILAIPRGPDRGGWWEQGVVGGKR